MVDIKDIHGFIVDNFLFGEDNGLDENTSFREENVMDSTGILELIMFLEEKYGIKIDDEDLVPENLDTLNNIVNFVKKKKTGAG